VRSLSFTDAGMARKASIQSDSSIRAHSSSAAALNSKTVRIGRRATIAAAQRRAPQQAIIASSASGALALFHDSSVTFNSTSPPIAADSGIPQAG